MQWDPQQYARFADERSRPFLDLLARVDVAAPRRVVDVGCGPGTLTALLAARWPGAVVEGIDSSPEMIAAAAAVPGPAFRVADAATWQPPSDTDVIVSNAALQWVPGHRDLLRRWAQTLPPGGALAVHVPGNFDAPSHRLLRSLAAAPRWAGSLDGVLRHDEVGEAAEYALLLADEGLHPDAWETSYVHLLPGADPVLEWVRGTALRPVLAALDADAAAAFTDEYAAQLRAAYPPTPHGTAFAFRRVFMVGRRPE